MSTEINKQIALEIAHVLFVDIVGYSKLSINEQHAAIDELNELVRTSEQFQKADSGREVGFLRQNLFEFAPSGDKRRLRFR